MIFEVHVLAACRVSVEYEYETEAKTPREAILKSEKWYPKHWVRVNQKDTYKFIIFEMLDNRKLREVF